MKKKTLKKLITLSSALAAGFAFADAALPEVTSCSMQQNPGGRIVTISYEFANVDVPAVVTLDVRTNLTGKATANESDWVSIGGEHICNAKGAVWRKVTRADLGSDGKFKIEWNPSQAWKDSEGNGFKVDAALFCVTAWPLDNTPDYMVVDVSSSAKPNSQRYYPAVDFLPGSEPGQKGAITNNSAYKTSMLVMRKIMAKDVVWTMGSVAGVEEQRVGSGGDTEATHQVSLTNNYYIGVFEITQSQWGDVADNSVTVPFFKVEGAMRPMENVAFNEIRYAHRDTAGTSVENVSITWDPSADSFLGKLRERTGILDFDLPSEAEWEFAARAGHGTGYWGDGSTILNADVDDNLGRIGRYQGNNPGKGESVASFTPATGGTAIVGSYLPNSWGIYDMHGNVREWCLDWWQEDISAYEGKVNVSLSDPSKCLNGNSPYNNLRRQRGGCYAYTAGNQRSAARAYAKHGSSSQIAGFRVVCRAGLK